MCLWFTCDIRRHINMFWLIDWYWSSPDCSRRRVKCCSYVTCVIHRNASQKVEWNCHVCVQSTVDSSDIRWSLRRKTRRSFSCKRTPIISTVVARVPAVTVVRLCWDAAAVAMMRKWQTYVYQAGSSANHLLAHHRKDCGPRASWPVQGRSSAGGGSQEFHLWAWLDTTVDSSADPTAAAQQSHTHSRVLLTSSQGFNRRGRMRTRSPAITDIPHKASIICYLLQNQHNLWSSVLVVLTFIRSRDVHGFLNSKVPWYKRLYGLATWTMDKIFITS